jgi:hypothetical protein
MPQDSCYWNYWWCIRNHATDMWSTGGMRGTSPITITSGGIVVAWEGSATHAKSFTALVGFSLLVLITEGITVHHGWKWMKGLTLTLFIYDGFDHRLVLCTHGFDHRSVLCTHACKLRLSQCTISTCCIYVWSFCGIVIIPQFTLWSNQLWWHFLSMWLANDATFVRAVSNFGQNHCLVSRHVVHWNKARCGR